jgi:hypothetical protein
MEFGFRFPVPHDPDEPLSPRERTISIWLPRWLARLLKSKEGRILINITLSPP